MILLYIGKVLESSHIEKKQFKSLMEEQARS